MLENKIYQQIALITCSDYPDGTADDQLMVHVLERLGYVVTFEVWSDEAVDWSTYRALVIRSTWDYHVKLAEFGAWLATVASLNIQVINSPEVLRWNANKRYLRDLEQQGSKIVPTVWATRGRAVDLEHVLQSNGWPKAVIKPAIGASAYQTWITDASSGKRDQALLRAMMHEGDVLIQPFMREIIREGEYSLVFFDRIFSHAVVKKPRTGDFRVQEAHGGSTRRAEVSKAIIDQCITILNFVKHRLTYARVDGVVQNDVFILMELELIEPDLCLSNAPGAADRFALAIDAAIGHLGLLQTVAPNTEQLLLKPLS